MQTNNENTVRAAGQARMQATNESNRSLLAGVSAGNLRRTARSVSPGLAYHTNAVANGGAFSQSLARPLGS